MSHRHVRPSSHARSRRRLHGTVFGALLVLVLVVVAGLGGSVATATTAVDARDRQALPATGGLHWPCGRIDVWVNPDGAPKGWRRQLARALRALDSATGLRFRLAGTTHRRPAPDLRVTVAGTLGQPASVLLTWGSRESYPKLLAPQPGKPRGASAATVVTWTPWRILAAQVVFDRAAASRQEHLFAHELGHVVGMPHSADPSSAMAPYTQQGSDTYTAADRAHLRLAHCVG